MSTIQTFNDEQIENLRKGGKILSSCLQHVSSLVKEGVKTKELDEVAEEFIRSKGAEPGFKGYQNYPATLCTSVNEECVHGIPGDRTLQSGDIIAIDCGVLLNELYTDACVTVSIGDIPESTQKLMDASKEALEAGISILKAGIHVGDLSARIQHEVESRGFSVVRALTGHGLGTTLHQYPDVPNFGEAGNGPKLPENTIIAIEPIVSAGSNMIKDKGDGWTICTKDDALSSHYEHTVLVLKEGVEVLA